jgi:signal transduction histidine kinase
VPASHRSFNYPQITQLVELTSIFEGPLERALLAEKIQHTEQLATVGMLGASLAHEIRNPLVSLKAFVQLLPTRHHEPAFREKFFSLMTEEVKRIDRLTEQLLDLASPRAYLAQSVQLNVVVQAGLDLVKPRASEAEVQIITDLAADPDLVSSDPAAVKQVLLNLCLNAIQVLEGTKADRWIRIRTVSRPGAVELAVEDSGPGISPAIRAKLFQPFQSTKSSGFGLGLAICRDILSNLDASIVAAPSAPGKGAEFRILLPCPR